MNTRTRFILIVLILLFSALYCVYFFKGYEGLSDGNDYAGLARSILRGEGYSLGHLYPLALAFDENIPQPNNLWAPAYPVYLLIWFFIFGANDTAILIATIFALWMFIVAVFLLVRKLLNADYALLAAAFLGLNQAALSTALEGSPEMLTGSLLVLSILPLIGEKGIRNIIISAVVFGFAVLSRYQVAVIALPIIIFYLDKRPRVIALWLLTVFAAISPWLVRNYTVFGNPVYTLQAYGEFTKGMGHLEYYYYTYRSFIPMSLWYALSEFPFYVMKKFAAGFVFFSWWLIVVLNFPGAIPFVFGALRARYLESSHKKFMFFSLASLLLIVGVSSLNGIHLRHLINIQGLLAGGFAIGFYHLRSRIPIFNKRAVFVIAVLLFLLPARFPFQEMKLAVHGDAIAESREIYDIISANTLTGDIIVSDASDAVWWYCDRPSIWIPVKYEDLRKLIKLDRADYIYFEKTDEYLDRLTGEELVEFFTETEIIDSSPLGWGLYRIIK